MDDYPMIADHGLVGDLQTAALVSTDGTVDLFCSPRFDAPGADLLGVVDRPLRTGVATESAGTLCVGRPEIVTAEWTSVCSSHRDE